MFVNALLVIMLACGGADPSSPYHALVVAMQEAMQQAQHSNARTVHTMPAPHRRY